MEKRGFTPSDSRGRAFLFYDRWTPVERALAQAPCFCCDAAGQVKVSTVGGIVTGFRGALE